MQSYCILTLKVDGQVESAGSRATSVDVVPDSDPPTLARQEDESHFQIMKGGFHEV